MFEGNKEIPTPERILPVVNFDSGIIPFEPSRVHVPLVLGFGEAEEALSREVLEMLAVRVPQDGWISELQLKVECITEGAREGKHQFIFELVRLTAGDPEMTGYRCKPLLEVHGDVSLVVETTPKTLFVSAGERFCLVVKLPRTFGEEVLFLRFSGGITYGAL